MKLNSVQIHELLEQVKNEADLAAHAATLRLVRVSPFEMTSVYEVRQKSRRTFVKVFRERESWERTLEMQEDVVRHQLPAPSVLAHGIFTGGMWVQFTDGGRAPRIWSRHSVRCAMKTLAQIHDSPTEIFTSGNRSHTPGYAEVHQQLQAYSVDQFHNMLVKFGVPAKPRQVILRLYIASKNWLHALGRLPSVPSHGDYHGGNVLFKWNNVSPQIIDWEYAHQDVPYFDLFQFLDATSPFDPLPLKGSRRFAIQTYLDARTSPQEATWRSRWVRGYYRFSILHLLWILTRIHMDLQKQSFPRESLYRQIGETVHGILSLDRHLRKL